MEYIECIVRYFISEYRLMQKQKTTDKELARGSIDEVIAARELVPEDEQKSLYFQAHFPNGHPNFPNMGGCWVLYDLLGSN